MCYCGICFSTVLVYGSLVTQRSIAHPRWRHYSNAAGELELGSNSDNILIVSGGYAVNGRTSD